MSFELPFVFHLNAQYDFCRGASFFDTKGFPLDPVEGEEIQLVRVTFTGSFVWCSFLEKSQYP